MRATGRTVSYAVNRKCISARVEIFGTECVGDLRKYKARTRTASLDGFRICAPIESLTIGRNVSFLLRAPRKGFIGSWFFLLAGKESLSVAVCPDFEDKLFSFLCTVAAKRNVLASELLYELSSFTKGDAGVPGKKSVFDLSESRGRVIVGKRACILKEGPCSRP
jgi:hypothetical protein